MAELQQMLDTEQPYDFSFNGNINLKPAYAKIQLNSEQLVEYAKCEADPLYFIENYVKIISLDHGTIPFKPWEFQKNMIRTMVKERFTICKMPRQVGKCCGSSETIYVRNKSTGEQYETTIGEFHQSIKDQMRTLPP